MEYLDIYDCYGNHLGSEERSIVHRDALWHNTVHCWLYDRLGSVYFQVRKDEKTLYTTASGHILAGESIKCGFVREVLEELGVRIDYDSAELVMVNKFVLDKKKKDGSMFRDRAFANVYVCLYEGKDTDFLYDSMELDGLVKVNAKEAYDLFKQGYGSIKGQLIRKNGTMSIIVEKDINFSDFLVNDGETALTKYGDILMKVIALVENSNS